MTLTEQLQPLLDKRLLAVLLATVFWPTTVLAQEHLLPWSHSPGSGIGISSNDVLREDVRVSAIVESLYPPFAVGVERSGNAWRVFYLRPDARSLEEAAKREKPPVRCEIGIAPSLGAHIESIWEAMLGNAQIDKDYPLLIDGSEYYFSGYVNGDLKTATAGDAPASSKPGQLQNVVYAMRALCKSRDEKSRAELMRLADGLYTQLEKKN